MDDLKLAQEMYEDAMAATRDQRTQIEEDLRFSDPSNPQQWDEAVKRQRENDPGGARPCLVMDHTGQYVANVAGQVTKNPPAIHTVPVGSGADVKVSEKIDGILRHIEYASRAQQHYGVSLTSASRAGVGYLVARPKITDRALNYQEPRISSVADPLRVVFDPWSVELDGSDADFAYLLTSLSVREFERRFGAKAAKVSFGNGDRNRLSDDAKSIIIAERWLKVEESRNVVVYQDANGEEQSGTEDEYHTACHAAGMTLPFIRNFTDKKQCVKWHTMSGAEILQTPKVKMDDGTEEDGYYPADSIGIVPVYGYWGIKDGRLTYCGIPRRAMNPQRAYNYHMSEQLAYMGTAPKSPFIAGMRAMKGEGILQLWERAAVDTRATLIYNDWDEVTNSVVPPPQRSNVSVNLQNHIQGAQQALADIEASIGMYRANLGAPSNETSGVAIDARKEQGEAATAHFPQNLAASLGQVGRICLQMIPKLIDTKRQQRILGIDMKPSVVTVDPQQDKAISDDGAVINPNVGRYDVRVVVGASYSTQRSQAQDALASVMQSAPDLTPAIAPLWAQQLDFPHADKLAQVLAAMAPGPVQAILNPDQAGKPTVEQLMQENEKLQQTMQMMQEAGAQLQTENEELKAKRDVEEGKLLIEGYKAKTDRMQALAPAIDPNLIQTVVMQTIQSLMQQPQPEAPPADDMGGLPMDIPPDMPPPEMLEQQPMSPPDAGFSSPEGMPQ